MYTLTGRQRDSVSLGVEESSDLGELAVPLDRVLHRRRLHQERVLAVILGDRLMRSIMKLPELI